MSLLTAGFFCNDTTIRVIQNFVEKAESRRGVLFRDSSKRGFSIQKDDFPDAPDIELGAIDMVRRRSTTVERLVEEYQVEGDPTESCIFHLLLRHFNPTQLKDWLKENPRIDEIPFDSSTKYMTTLHSLHLDPEERKYLFGDLEQVSSDTKDSQAEELVVFLKGAPEKVFQFCSSKFTEQERNIWKERQQAFGSQGMRVLGLAYKRISSKEDFKSVPDATDFNLTCLVGIMDPPRPEAIDAIRCAQQAGITVKMITGDHPTTALAIGKQLGLQNNPTRDSDNEMTSITGTQLDALLQQNDEKQFDEIVLANDIFARTTPEHKLRIVQSLQRQNLVCSMTGDGVNDCPALKAANIGVAMGITGTEVAKDAGKMILLDDNFATIVDAIRMGRCTYQNLVKILTFVLPTNSAQAFSIVFALIIGVEVPIIAVQILWVNMITSITLGLVLAFEPVEERVMQFPPRSPNKEIFGRFLIRRIIFITVLFVACIYLNIEWEREDIARAVSSIREIRTIAVNTLSFCQIGYLMSCRSLKAPVTSISKLFLENKVIYIGIILVIFFQMLFTYAPFMQSVFETEGLDALAWGKIAFFMVIAFICTEIEKFIYFNYFYLPSHQHLAHHSNEHFLIDHEEKQGNGEEKKLPEKEDYLDQV
jgi:magnesium-transporting ATPase (P-type)